MTAASATSSRSGLYPIGLKVGGRPCLVVGSGPIARRKAEELLDCGALVHLVAPPASNESSISETVEGLTRSRRAFVPSDLDGAQLVIAATDEPGVEDAVAQAAAVRGIPCNVVDVNHLCTFYAAAVLRRGALTVSVATDGKFPLFAVAIRDRIAAALGDAIGPALEILGAGRDLASARFPDDPDERVAALRRLLSEPALTSILEGRLAEFEAHWESWKTELSARA